MKLAVSHSLRARLLWFLLGAIVLTVAAQAYIAYRTARNEADEIFDYQMQQMAMSLRSGLPVSAVEVGPDLIIEDQNDEFIVQVWSANGIRVFQSAARAALPQRAVLGFSDVEVEGARYRVFSVQSKTQVIQVAQDNSIRRQMASTLAIRTVAPVALVAPLLMLVVWWVVSASLAPVARVRHQVAARQADDLSPVSEEALPDEVRPLIHELNLLFLRVRKAFDAQQHFVADAAHELRSPLAALRLQVQGLQRAGNDETRELAVARLTSGIDRATRLVEQLLILARQEASAASGSAPQPVALAEVSRMAMSDVAAAAQSRHIDLGLGYADELEIEGHSEALRILIRNLLENAIKYTPAGGTVDVEIRRQPDTLLLSVDDSGPGIPEADQVRVLDRFYRVSGSETAAGTGLGLARSNRLDGLRAEVGFPLPI
jgi:two-component system OmpR family sensor kinase